MPIDEAAIRGVLDAYCREVRQTRRDPGHHPEKSLYPHFERALRELAAELGHDVRIIQQYRQSEVGAPDFGVRFPSGSVSFVEAKAPDKNLGRLTGHDRAQFERYKRLLNLIYTNYSELHLYQEGELRARAELVPAQCLEPRQSYATILSTHNVAPAMELLSRFLAFQIPPIRSVRGLAGHLAPAAWLVRDAVREAMETGPEDSPLHQIYGEFRDVLFYELDLARFADAYAQTLAYGLLLARQATETELTVQNIPTFIDYQRHRLLSATLTLLSQPPVVQMIGWTINNLVVVVNRVSSEILLVSETGPDPLLYFYEDFLEMYDPDLRKERGVYYTPPEVVNLQTRIIGHQLIHHFERPYGFADEMVQTLDPAVGTGTYLVSALKEGCKRVEQAMGADSVPDAASAMARRLYGFEILVGPYTVAHFRLASAIEESGGQMAERLAILLTNTLLPPEGQPETATRFAFMSDALTDERLSADEVKARIPIMVILGNPPYRRGKAEEGWVWDVLLETFREPIREEHSVDLKNLADRYVSFYRWAIWKLFECESAPRQGVLSFISNSSWILGGAFGGMRQVFRQYFDRIYIVDLHGNSRAPLPAGVAEDENIFESVQVGVAISICIADGSRSGQEAEVYYYGDLWGPRELKYAWLDQAPADLSQVAFVEVQGTGTAPFYPDLRELFENWPALKADVFVFSHSGVQTKRDRLVVAPTRAKLQRQIQSFLEAPDSRRPEIFHDTAARNAAAVASHSLNPRSVTRYGYRPLDCQYLYNDRRFIDRPRPRLQRVWGHRNLALVTLPSGHGAGPVVFLHHCLPDLHAFRGSYGGYALPLWDNRHEREAQRGFIDREHNLNPTLLDGLEAIWGQHPMPGDVFAYCYAVLSAPSYSLEFSGDLTRSFPRVPFPRRWESFQEGVALGERLVRLHSLEERYPGDGSLQIHGSPQRIEFAEYNRDDHQVKIGPNAWVGPVSPEAWAYSVSGYKVLRQWLLRRREVLFELGLRQELLDVVWIIERSVEMSGEFDDLLERLLEGETLTSEELGLGSDASDE